MWWLSSISWLRKDRCANVCGSTYSYRPHHMLRCLRHALTALPIGSSGESIISNTTIATFHSTGPTAASLVFQMAIPRSMTTGLAPRSRERRCSVPTSGRTMASITLLRIRRSVSGLCRMLFRSRIELFSTAYVNGVSVVSTAV